MLKSIYNFFYQHYHSRYHGIYRHAKKLFIFDLFLLGLSVTLFGASIFFFFWKPGVADMVNLKLSLGAQRIQSGDVVHLTIDYENNSKVLLKEPLLSLRLPVGFEIDREKTPKNIFSKESFFKIENIKPGAKGQAEIYGRLWAEPKKEEKITAILSYVPENYQAREQKFGNYLLNLPESILQTTLTLPQNTLAGSRTAVSYKIKNTSDTMVKNLSVNFDWDNGVQLDPGQKIVNFDLAPNEEKEITGQINIPAKSGDYKLSAETDVLVNNQTTKLNSDTAVTQATFPDVSVSMDIDNAPPYTEPGGSFTANIKWKKDQKFEIKNKKLSISFSPAIVDLQKTASENNLKTDGKILYATRAQRTALGNSAVNGDSFAITVYLLPTFKNFTLDTPFLQITPRIEATSNIDNKDQIFYSVGKTEKIKLATEIFLRAEARYYTAEGDQLGRGPLPPTIGETTKYWMSAIISNTSNAAREAKFSATLPAGATFTGKQSVSIGSAIKYDDNSRKISWNYYELPANSQTGLYFEVAVTPSPEQIGKNISLLKDTSFSATDKETGKIFNLKNNEVDNALNIDDRGAVKGSKVES